MKLYVLQFSDSGKVTIEQEEGSRDRLDERHVHSSFPKAKKAAVEIMRTNQGILKQAIADLRAAKNYEAL